MSQRIEDRKLVLHFDYLSPYAYLGFKKLLKLKHDPKSIFSQIEVEYHPILFAALLNTHGQLGPAEVNLEIGISSTFRPEFLFLGSSKTEIYW